MVKKNVAKGVASAVAIAALAAGGLAVSSGSNNGSASTAATTGTPVPAHGGAGQGGPMMGTPVTGAAATKATAAALAKYPGTVERVLKTTGGSYVVHVFKNDGTEVHVLVSAAFAVTGTETGGPPGGAPNRGRSPSEASQS
ncbi:MAG TPA: hypothetical protein VE570_02585 [Thermoleophilaceae bacterium]|nr:hypothetical protein [Thermoleophilaceae bacterium]